MMNLTEVKDIQGVLDYAEFLKHDMMNDRRQHEDEASFKTADGSTQIDVAASIYEPGYEDFDATVNIRENGHELFKQDASNVGPYHNESYTQSKFDTLDKTKEYLMEKYAGVAFEFTKDEPVPPITNEFNTKWDRPAYAASLNPPTRLVFEDQGSLEKDGDTFHRVAFAYACDRKTVGRDEPLANPYLVNRRDDNGVSHAVLLPDNMYNRLMAMANHEDTERSRWTGVIQADVIELKDGGLTADLTTDAMRNHRIMTPVKAFDETEHDLFIKKSLQEIYQKTAPAPIIPAPPSIGRTMVQDAPEPLERLLYEDQGTVQSKGGETFHKVAFAFACDQKTPGIDSPVANPYLVNRGKNEPQGRHAVLLSEDLYERLQQVSNNTGMEGSRWAGVFEATLVKTKSKEHLVPDLSQAAVDRGCLRMPTEPFDEAKHDHFVKQSLIQLSKYGPSEKPAPRIYGEEQSERRLPEVPTEVPSSLDLGIEKD